MNNLFSNRLSEILSFSREEAERLASRSVGPEHLLIAMMRGKGGVVHDMFEQMNINLQSIKTELEDKVRGEEEATPIPLQQLTLNEQSSNILRQAVIEARTQ